VARWLLVGFIHGVMNTDNTAVSGETIDYGPCAFMDAYNPATVFSSIDLSGRYAYGNQPRTAAWNMARLAETLLPLLSEDQSVAMAVAQEALDGFRPRFEATYLRGLRRKIGLSTNQNGDDALTRDLLSRMAAGEADFTLTFRALCGAAACPDGDEAVRTLFQDGTTYDGWSTAWRSRLSQEPGPAGAHADAMRALNPVYIPRNHQVEAALAAAVTHGDYGPFETLLEVNSHPFEERPGMERFTLPPEPDQRVLQTFCGT
jgi:serine/tyrosine/threonine adenylyltransferase